MMSRPSISRFAQLGQVDSVCGYGIKSLFIIYGVFLGSFYTFDVASKRSVSINMRFLISISLQMCITVECSLVEEFWLTEY